MQNTIGPHELALVSPQDFLDRMTQLWSQPPFSMHTSQALLGGWRVMADHYRSVVLSNLSDDPHKSSFALPLPTGSGKTEGTCVSEWCRGTLSLMVRRCTQLVAVRRLRLFAAFRSLVPNDFLRKLWLSLP
jgi:hypothetical protein